MNCSNILTAKTTSINTTSVTVQNALDRIQVYLQQSYTSPYPIDNTGKILTAPISMPGTTAYPRGLVPVVNGAGATVTGTGVGIKFYRYVGGPYLAQIPTTGLAANAASITLLSNAGAQVCPAIPQAGDLLLINTTALLGGADSINYQVWATVKNGIAYTEVSGTRTYKDLPLTPSLRPGIPDTTVSTTSIAYKYDNSTSSGATWTTYLLRPTAFLISYNQKTAKTELGLLDPCVTTGGIIDTTQNYTLLATLCSGRSPLLDGLTPPFAVVSLSNNTFVTVNLQTKSDTDAYLSDKQAANGFSTYMGVRSMIHLKSKSF